MTALSLQTKLMLQNNYGVVLCNSTTENGEPFFHFVKADKKNIEQMNRDYQAGKEVDFTSYGEILLSGWGENPEPQHELIMSEYFQTE